MRARTIAVYEAGPLLAQMLEWLEDLHVEPSWFERAFSDARVRDHAVRNVEQANGRVR